MARIADKHGLTNKYRPIGTGKRVVRKGRPRKYFGGSRSRSSRSHTSYTATPQETLAGAIIALIIVGIVFLFILPFFTPLFIGIPLIYFVDEGLKKKWGLKRGKWSMPASTLWVVVSTIEMVFCMGALAVCWVDGTASYVPLFVSLALYIALSILILCQKYNKVKTQTISSPNCDTVTSPTASSHSAKKIIASEHAELAQSNIKIMSTTLDPDEFFKSYKNLIYHQRQVTLFWRSQGGDDEIEELMESLIDDKADFVNEFIERCYNEGILAQIKDKILQHSADLTNANMQYITDLLSEESEEDFSDDDIKSKELCSTLRKNLQVDMAFWDEMHLNFKCNLVTSYTSLQLNFEIKNESGVPWYNGGGGITIKANFYDRNGNLIHVDDVYIEDEVLVKNRFSDYLYFDFDDISEAVSVQLYAYQEE